MIERLVLVLPAVLACASSYGYLDCACCFYCLVGAIEGSEHLLNSYPCWPVGF